MGSGGWWSWMRPLHRGCGEILPEIHHRRIVRQVCALPRGTTRMLEILEAITRGQATLHDLEVLERLAGLQEHCPVRAGADGSQPGFEHPALLPREYEEHILQHKCRAGVCSDLIQYQIVAERCVGCQAYYAGSAGGSHPGRKRRPIKLKFSIASKCGACMEKCRFDAIIRS